MAKAILLTRNEGLLRRRTGYGDWCNNSAWRSSRMLAFWCHLRGENLWEDLRKLKALWILKKAQELLTFRRGSDWERWTVKWINCWKTRVFYRSANSRDMQRISRAQIELTRGIEETRIFNDISVQNGPMRPSHLKQTKPASRRFQRDPRFSWESRFKQAQREARVQKHPKRSLRFKDKTRVMSSTSETCVFSCQR